MRRAPSLVQTSTWIASRPSHADQEGSDLLIPLPADRMSMVRSGFWETFPSAGQSGCTAVSNRRTTDVLSSAACSHAHRPLLPGHSRSRGCMQTGASLYWSTAGHPSCPAHFPALISIIQAHIRRPSGDVLPDVMKKSKNAGMRTHLGSAGFSYDRRS